MDIAKPRLESVNKTGEEDNSLIVGGRVKELTKDEAQALLEQTRSPLQREVPEQFLTLNSKLGELFCNHAASYGPIVGIRLLDVVIDNEWRGLSSDACIFHRLIQHGETLYLVNDMRFEALTRQFVEKEEWEGHKMFIERAIGVSQLLSKGFNLSNGRTVIHPGCEFPQSGPFHVMVFFQEEYEIGTCGFMIAWPLTLYKLITKHYRQ
ncbi:MAG: hypothetical protein AB7E47_15750 [Desulfovibrionaceae bacterium]